MTITLSGSVPTEFQLGLYGDILNADGTTFTVSDNNGGSVTTGDTTARPAGHADNF